MGHKSRKCSRIHEAAVQVVEVDVEIVLLGSKAYPREMKNDQ